MSGDQKGWAQQPPVVSWRRTGAGVGEGAVLGVGEGWIVGVGDIPPVGVEVGDTAVWEAEADGVRAGVLSPEKPQLARKKQAAITSP